MTSETETVADVLKDFDVMASECGGLQPSTIHAMTQRIAAAHARELGELREDRDAIMSALKHAIRVYVVGDELIDWEATVERLTRTSLHDAAMNHDAMPRVEVEG